MSSSEPAPTARSPYLLSLGNIHATEYWAVTPAGSWPLARMTVVVRDRSATTPGRVFRALLDIIWTSVFSVLASVDVDPRKRGYIAITVRADGHSYLEQIPVVTEPERAEVLNRVAYLQHLIGNARISAR